MGEGLFLLNMQLDKVKHLSVADLSSI